MHPYEELGCFCSILLYYILSDCYKRSTEAAELLELRQRSRLFQAELSGNALLILYGERLLESAQNHMRLHISPTNSAMANTSEFRDWRVSASASLSNVSSAAASAAATGSTNAAELSGEVRRLGSAQTALTARIDELSSALVRMSVQQRTQQQQQMEDQVCSCMYFALASYLQSCWCNPRAGCTVRT